MAIELIHPARPDVAQSDASHLITATSLTALLAYIQRHAPSRLSNRRYLPVQVLRTMAAWIGLPRPQLRTLRRHRLLAAHLALLEAAGLVCSEGPSLTLLPAATSWLFAAPEAQMERLLAVLASPAWPETLKRLGLEEVLTIDYAAYLAQQLRRQRANCSLPEPPYAHWLADQADRWQLALCRAAPPHVLFDLLQLGDWSPQERLLTCTPLSIAAGGRGYSFAYLCSLFKSALGRPLTSRRQKRCAEWLQRGDQFRVEAGYLLSTAHDEQLAAIMNRRSLRPIVVRQLGPRHALVRQAMLPRLQRWLAREGFPLTLPPACRAAEQEEHASAAYEWLGLRLLVELAQLIPLPYAPPHAALDALARRIPEAERTELEALCQELISRLQRAIAGHDAFFPAVDPPSRRVVEQVRAALATDRSLRLTYQGLGEPAPRERRVQPLRLEQRGTLFYLHAYCYLAEAERVFRLDRLQACEDA